MRENRLYSSEGGARFNPSFLPLSTGCRNAAFMRQQGTSEEIRPALPETSTD